jgi:hypothetical protein
MKAELVAFGVGDERAPADGRLVDVGDFHALADEAFAFGGNVIDLECRGERRTRSDAQRLAVPDAEGRAADGELRPMVAEHLARSKADDIAVKGYRIRYVANGISDERYIFYHCVAIANAFVGVPA